MFSRWLAQQRERDDDVGRFAHFALADKNFPITSRLHHLLRWCGEHPELRRLTKLAHAEWRKARREAA